MLLSTNIPKTAFVPNETAILCGKPVENSVQRLFETKNCKSSPFFVEYLAWDRITEEDMVTSMTGFGRGEVSEDGITVGVELRSVNSRFLEISARLPRSLSSRENEIKDLVRKEISRGKINILVILEKESNGSIPVKVNPPAAKAYYKLLNELKRTVRLKESVKLGHLLEFSDIFETLDDGSSKEKEWVIARAGILSALHELKAMRIQEGKELETDFRHRIGVLQGHLDDVDRLSREQVPVERERLRERIKQLLESETIDEGRLEMEIAVLADRLDVTEECVRFRSHNKFFLEALDTREPVGRKLNFLLQEMHREVNTIGSKSSSTEIAHIVVHAKEELERIREQLQNIE
jgi:uncharacterized protein (TIGR00255 family)